MTKYHLPGTILIFALWLHSCGQPTTAESLDPAQNHFFNVEEYFQQEVERLQKEQPKVVKELMLNGTTEIIRPDSIDYADELSVFLNSGINKVSWLDRYAADTVRTSGGALQQTRYEARDEKLRTRLVEVTYQGGHPATIRIHNRTKNILLQATQQLVYRPGQEAVIEQTQQIQFMKPNNLRIHLQFQE